MKTSSKSNDALIAFLTHAITSARAEQTAFGESATKDVESALQWRAEGALVAVFTERHATSALDQLKLGRDLAAIYENLIDRLTLLASGHNGVQAETRAIATLARSLKDWLEEPIQAASLSLTTQEIAALRDAHAHVRAHMAHQHSFEVRDAAMLAIGKAIAAATSNKETP